MPASRSKSGGRFAGALGRLLLPTVAFALAGACKSTPCVGDACPAACNGAACDEPEPPLEDPTAPGRSATCDSNASCDEARGFSCVSGTCRHACRSHFDCGGVGFCESLGTDGSYCTLTTPPSEPGGFYSNCPTGECGRGFSCIGAGVADTESYCTIDCVVDGDCPTGYHCDGIPRATSTEPERLVCMPRGFCAECETNADCLSVPGGVCARDASGERRCTQLCDPGRNSCPWGTATECAVTDDELGAPTCQHRFGACHGDGSGCHPCVRDGDCPGGDCVSSTYTGERWCVDLRRRCTCAGRPISDSFCAGAADCPRSPSDIPMVCLDPNAPGEGVCYGVNLPGSNQFSCWR